MDDAWADPHDFVAGLAVRHLTLRDIVLLQSAHCPYLVHRVSDLREHEPDEVTLDFARVVMLYQSVDYRAGWWRKRRFLRQLRKVESFVLHGELIDYIERTFALSDADSDPRAASRIRITYWSVAADYVAEFGVSVLDMPFRQLAQVCRAKAAHKHPGMKFTNPSDLVVSRYLSRQ